MIRTFVALFPPDDVVDEAARFLDRLRGEGDVKWVARDLLHLTVRFFGDLSEEEVETVKSATAEVASARAPIAARLAGTGTFPPRGRPRVYWIGMDRGAEELVALGGALERAYVDAGMGAADRPLTPHLTIGRVRRGRKPSPPSDLLRDFARLTFESADFIFTNVCVVRSDLAPRGPTYRPLGEYAFSRPG